MSNNNNTTISHTCTFENASACEAFPQREDMSILVRWDFNGACLSVSYDTNTRKGDVIVKCESVPVKTGNKVRPGLWTRMVEQKGEEYTRALFLRRGRSEWTEESVQVPVSWDFPETLDLDKLPDFIPVH